ncbi:MAG: NUDIX hydrolase [Exilispira sp.]|jgi:8-oxo-dGTP pyrophosphatase MutT (NUDIX family)|nr:NUDIX hydrolase [Exilispira sp.]
MDELKVTWILSNEIDYSFSIKQVYGFLFDNFGRILVHDDLGRFNLPGGKPEKDETVIQTLERECIEESQVTFKEPELIGFQLVENDKDYNYKPYIQLRFIAKIDQLFPLLPDPVTSRAYKRSLVSISQVNTLLKWGEAGRVQLEAAVKKIKNKLCIEIDQYMEKRIIDE